MRDETGSVAIEFAFLAPMLIFGLLAMADLGLAISERMTMGHILRAGAQAATDNIGTAKVDHVLRTTAARNMTVAETGTTGDDTALAVAVDLICTCAAQPLVVVGCSVTCEGSTPTQVFYTLSADKTYSGLILPQFSLSRTLQVQVR
jgi:pilus assembly protein CpaE